MTAYRNPRQARRPTWRQRHDLWWLGLLMMIASAAIVVGVLYFGLALLFSLRAYIPAEVLR